jgi:hypothetical protein
MYNFDFVSTAEKIFNGTPESEIDIVPLLTFHANGGFPHSTVKAMLRAAEEIRSVRKERDASDLKREVESLRAKIARVERLMHPYDCCAIGVDISLMNLWTIGNQAYNDAVVRGCDHRIACRFMLQAINDAIFRERVFGALGGDNGNV